MKPPACLHLLAFAVSFAAAARADVPWLPSAVPPKPATGPALTQGNFLKPEVGQAVLDAALKQFPDRASWDTYAAHLRTRLQEGANLAPWPRRTPLNAVIRQRRAYDGYSVENVAFESVPGYFVTGNLYRPLDTPPPHAVVLSTHGHYGRINKPEDYDNHGRFSPIMQNRCASLARMGAVVLSIDMFAAGESMAILGQDAHKNPLAVTVHTWNAMRALDFLLGLEGVDPARVGVSGESGGGTQTFLLTALDPRVTVSAPVVMVSSYFFGGCACESGLPIHRSADHFANNAMIAALAAPRPLLLVSNGKDWTKHNPEIEFPSSRKSTPTTARPRRSPTSTCPTRATTTARRNAPRFTASSPTSSASISPPCKPPTARSTSRVSRWKSPRNSASSRPTIRFPRTPCTTPPRSRRR